VKKVSPYYLSPTGVAAVKAQAHINGKRLRDMRKLRELELELQREQSKRPGLPPITEY
jgi:hypothetical protein